MTSTVRVTHTLAVPGWRRTSVRARRRSRPAQAEDLELVTMATLMLGRDDEAIALPSGLPPIPRLEG
jgi:hypothetical protein